eukprot:COSAG01_NODE_9477_length_2436_cov_1.792041_1_plen_225_part_10
MPHRLPRKRVRVLWIPSSRVSINRFIRWRRSRRPVAQSPRRMVCNAQQRRWLARLAHLSMSSAKPTSSISSASSSTTNCRALSRSMPRPEVNVPQLIGRHHRCTAVRHRCIPVIKHGPPGMPWGYSGCIPEPQSAPLQVVEHSPRGTHLPAEKYNAGVTHVHTEARRGTQRQAAERQHDIVSTHHHVEAAAQRALLGPVHRATVDAQVPQAGRHYLKLDGHLLRQ